MSHKEFDSNIRGAFEKMDEHDIDQAMQAKEDVWKSLDVNDKKPSRINALAWFLLGLLLAIGGQYLIGLNFGKTEAPATIIAKNETPKTWEIQLKDLENKIADMDHKYNEKSSLLDSLNLQNQKLQNELQLLASTKSNNISSLIQTEYVRDTIYLTEIKREVITQEKIIKDTVFIEVPIEIEDDELMTDISNNPDLDIKKDKPRSIQFNFRTVKSENK